MTEGDSDPAVEKPSIIVKLEGVIDGILTEPEILSKIKGEKRLGVQTEDHPVEYINFQGEIPKGNYGAGTVKIWDKGKYKLISQAPKSMKVELKGKKIKGEYALVRLQGRNWLIFRVGTPWKRSKGGGYRV